MRTAAAGVRGICNVSRIDAIERFRDLVSEGAGIVSLNDAIAAALGRVPAGCNAVVEAASRCSAGDAAELASFVWYVLGLRGDGETYDALENSFVGEAMERRRGIPITIAAAALGVAAMMGIGLDGIGMPGHFLLREVGASGRFFDLFHGPGPLDAEECVRLHGELTGGARWSDDYLRPVDSNVMALRMLTNLKSAYRRAGDDRSLRTVMLLRRTYLGDREREEFARLMRATN